MRSVARKSMIYLMLLNGVVLSIMIIVYVKRDLQFVKCSIAVKEAEHDQENSQTSFRIKHNGSFTLSLNAMSPSPTKDVRPHQTHLISRTRCTRKVLLLIMVFTGPANFDRRTAIRKTWATDPSMNIRWKTVFLLGQAAGDRIQNEYLEAEEMIHRDLIRGDQDENYYNLTLKTQMGLEWASKYCEFQFLLKADDDVFVNPYMLVDYLEKPDTPQTKLYTGRCFYGAIPHRQGKYAVSMEEYNKTVYPGFCVGPAYLLSSDLVYKVVELFDANKKPLKLEDVYIGTLVEQIGGVKAVMHPWFRVHEGGHCTYSSETFAFHIASVRCIEELFNAAMKERVEYELTQLRSVRPAEHNNTRH